MSSQKTKNQSMATGFTIIEVVLVLAIAGLIFLMVFVALPALQRSQRDTARRNDMSRVDTSLVQYQTNNSTLNNNLPTAGRFVPSETDINADGDPIFPTTCNASSACKFVRDYMNTGASANDEKVNEFTDPDGKQYGMLITDNWGTLASGAALSGSVEYNEHSTLVYDATEGSYTIGGDSPYEQHAVYVVPGGKCKGTAVIQSEKRHFAILYRLEGAGVYCIDDQ